MLGNITVETSKINLKKNQRQNDKKKDKYAQIKRFHYDRWLQVYMNAFIYVDTEIIEEDEYLPATKCFVVNYKRSSSPASVPTHWIWFS